MLSIERILIDGAILSALMSVFLVTSLILAPRIWLQDYPKAIIALAPPLTVREKSLQHLFMIPFLLVFFGVPFLSARAVALNMGSATNFLIVFLHAFFILNIFNLFDAVVIDWLWLGLTRPTFALIPEARQHPELLLDKRKAIIDWLKGVVFSAVFGLIVAGVVMLTARL
jgi:hypothetical protein